MSKSLDKYMDEIDSFVQTGQYVYVVKVGRKPGLYNTWDEAKEMVDGYSGAAHIKKHTVNEAREYLGLPALSARMSTKNPPEEQNVWLETADIESNLPDIFFCREE